MPSNSDKGEAHTVRLEELKAEQPKPEEPKPEQPKSEEPKPEERKPGNNNDTEDPFYDIIQLSLCFDTAEWETAREHFYQLRAGEKNLSQHPDV